MLVAERGPSSGFRVTTPTGRAVAFTWVKSAKAAVIVPRNLYFHLQGPGA
jgi:hypothetical protein